MQYIATIFQFLMSIPVVGPYAVMVLKYIVPASLIVTAVAALMHSVIGVLVALSYVIPGMGALAEKLKTADDSAEGFFAQKIKPILDQLSLIPIPTKKQ